MVVVVASSQGLWKKPKGSRRGRAVAQEEEPLGVKKKEGGEKRK